MKSLLNLFRERGKQKMQIELGMTVEDKVTGFKGVVTGIVYYLSGCNQALVVPKATENGGRYNDPIWFDLQRLSVDMNTSRILLQNEKTPGFDKAPPKR